jgi:hypothetical protein
MTFENAGFEIVESVLSSVNCERAVSCVESIERSKAGSRELLEQPWCRTLADQLAIDEKLRSRLAGLIPVQCTYFEKSQESNWLVAYHQDLSIPVRARVSSAACSGWSEKEGVTYVQPPLSVLESLVAVRVHLDESTATNGPLRVIPGSHRNGRIQSREVAEFRQGHAEIECTAPRGAALVFKPLLLHASSKAEIHTPRRVLHFLFGPPCLPEGLLWRVTAQPSVPAGSSISVVTPLPPIRS